MKGDKNPSKRLDVRQKISEVKKNTPKPKWITPDGEVREMNISLVKQWHPDWILIEEDL